MIAKALLEIGKHKVCNIDVLRVVETQEYAATTGLVDDLEEQDMLEQLLDEVKPPYREGTQALHYLISTPFRYPPLQYGSRFGDITIPSYFYASEDVDTALAECAFYRFVFLNDITEPYGKSITSEHMSFSVHISSSFMSDLTLVSSKEITALLTSPSHYLFTQQLGKTLTQEHGTTVLRFYSARANNGINIAITEPHVITSAKPENNVNWICHTTAEKISFTSHGYRPISFAKETFLVDEELPRLA